MSSLAAVAYSVAFAATTTVHFAGPMVVVLVEAATLVAATVPAATVVATTAQAVFAALVHTSRAVPTVAPAAHTMDPLQPPVPAQILAPIEAAVPPEVVIVIDDKDEAAPLPSPTPAVVEVAGDALAYVSSLTGASIFTFGFGVSSFTSVRLPMQSCRRSCPHRRPLLLHRVAALAAASSPSDFCSRARRRAATAIAPAHGARTRLDSRTASRLRTAFLVSGDSSVEDSRSGSGSRR